MRKFVSKEGTAGGRFDFFLDSVIVQRIYTAVAITYPFLGSR